MWLLLPAEKVPRELQVVFLSLCILVLVLKCYTGESIQHSICTVSSTHLCSSASVLQSDNLSLWSKQDFNMPSSHCRPQEKDTASTSWDTLWTTSFLTVLQASKHLAAIHLLYINVIKKCQYNIGHQKEHLSSQELNTLRELRSLPTNTPILKMKENCLQGCQSFQPVPMNKQCSVLFSLPSQMNIYNKESGSMVVTRH